MVRIQQDVNVVAGPLSDWLLRGPLHPCVCGLLLVPKLFKLVCHSQVHSDPDHVGVLHRLLDLDVLVAEHLHLLPIVPEGAVEAVEQNS